MQTGKMRGSSRRDKQPEARCGGEQRAAAQPEHGVAASEASSLQRAVRRHLCQLRLHRRLDLGMLLGGALVHEAVVVEDKPLLGSLAYSPHSDACSLASSSAGCSGPLSRRARRSAR